ncbi:MAG: hypothetical protein CSA96_03155 [Bacteroidetes bacterium]|nr:MAG: hypothetical protein CSA96_03155 [Bacteroidota bacterium]
MTKVPIKALLLLLVFMAQALIPMSCETNRGQIIPYVNVNIPLLLYADLADLGIGESKLIEGGYNGIVLYRESDLLFHAYDRTCTCYPDHNKAVTENPSFFSVFECPECGSSFLLMNGAIPSEGPARYSLVEYRSSIQGDVLLIRN